VGDEVTVRVLKYNPETERVSLGLKQTQEDRGATPKRPSRRARRFAGKVSDHDTARSSSSSRGSRG